MLLLSVVELTTVGFVETHNLSWINRINTVNWQLAGYVMSSSIALLNIVASIVHQVVATQTQTRYEERKLPPLDGSRFTRESSDGLQALRDYLDGGSFDDDDDAEALKMSLEARKRTIGGECTSILT